MADAYNPPHTRAGVGKTFLFYAAMVAAAVALFAVIRSIGAGLPVPANAAIRPALAATQSTQSINLLLRVLLALSVIVFTARLMGGLFKYIGQPAVIGEVFGGILLGPSLLGRIAPDVYAYLLPGAVASFLSVYAQLGVIIYLFLVGLEFDLTVVKRSGHAALAISHASIILPFLLGSALALVLFPVLAPGGVPFTVFSLFIGVSLSVTAFPVLARILTDRKISKSHMGALALTCAAVDDVTAWCLLALVASITRAAGADGLRTVLFTVAFIVVVFGVVAPIARRFGERIDQSEQLSLTSLSIVLTAMLLSAMTTEYIGIHGFFGAFLLGAVIPHDSRIAIDLNKRLNDFVAVLLLPAFFAYTGMRTQIGLVSGLTGWVTCGLIVLVACVGKFGGTLIASRLSGLRWRDSAALGVLMNTRGLVELIVLNMGLDLGVLSPTLFTMLVIMALVTTFLTTPVLQVLLSKHPWTERAPAHAYNRMPIAVRTASVSGN